MNFSSPHQTGSDAWVHLSSESSTFNVADNDSRIVASNNGSTGLSVQGAAGTQDEEPGTSFTTNTSCRVMASAPVSLTTASVPLSFRPTRLPVYVQLKVACPAGWRSMNYLRQWDLLRLKQHSGLLLLLLLLRSLGLKTKIRNKMLERSLLLII